MDRPATSKSRGVCRYYNTPRGCFAGRNCKFQHGEEKFTSYDKSKTCKFYAKGYCHRGDKCWFLHEAPKAEVVEDASDDMCCICLEKPVTYGLLAGCNHVFCIECIRQWRDSKGKSLDVVESGMTKTCPLCRSSSAFITPSSRSYSANQSGKAEAIERYKASMKRVPCKYFEKTKSATPLCPFGSDCFYKHANADGTPFVFPAGIERYMRLYRNHMRSRAASSSRTPFPSHPFDVLNRIFDNPLDDLSATIEAIRASLPALIDRGNPWYGEMDDGFRGDDGAAPARADSVDRIETLEILADRMLASLGQWQDVGFNVNANEDLHLEDYDDDLPPLESIEGSPEIEITWGTIPSDHPLPHTREEPPEAQFPGLLLPSTPPLRPLDIGRPHPPQEFDEDEMRELPPTGSSPSRFSTVVGDRGRMIIHIDSDNEDEDDEGSDSGESTEVEDGGDDRSEGTCGRASPEDERASEQALHDAVITQETQSILAETEDLGRRAAAVVDDAVNHIEHDADPPFVTDGRGRVVWTRQGRGTTNDTANTRPAAPPQRRAGPSERHLKTRRSGRDALSPSVEPPVGGHASPASAQQSTSGGFITDGRGRVISTDTGSTHTAAVANPGPDEEPRADESDDSEGSQRSFLGRVYDAVFS